MTTAPLDTLLSLSDSGAPPASIAHQLDIPLHQVYALLRTHRPDRPRSRRARTSELRLKILALAKVAEPARVAKLMAGRCSRAYIYKVLGEGR